MLLAAAFRPLRNHRERDDPVFVLSIVPGHGIKYLSVGAAEGHADDAARRRYQAEILAVRSYHLNTGIRCHVEASPRVERAAVAVSTAFELRELALVGKCAILPDVKHGKRRSVGDVQVLFVRAQDDAVGGQVLAVTGDPAFRAGVKNPT